MSETDQPYDAWGSGGITYSEECRVNAAVENVDKWDRRFLDMATLVAGWSKDPSTQVGAVLVREDRTVASVGFNGFPRGCSDDDELYEDRETKYARVVHAELNAILSANEDVRGHTLYVTHMPCAGCAAAIVQSGVRRAVWFKRDNEMTQRWVDSMTRAMSLLREAGVKVREV